MTSFLLHVTFFRATWNILKHSPFRTHYPSLESAGVGGSPRNVPKHWNTHAPDIGVIFTEQLFTVGIMLFYEFLYGKFIDELGSHIFSSFFL